jgi:bifunctional non-homologous end joining protein LigD
MPRRVRPMLATLVEEPFDKAGWFFEIKWDGFRAIAEVERGRVNMYSRNLLPFNAKYPSIVAALKKLKEAAVLDGEIVALNAKGMPDFHALQDYGERGAPLQYVVFDLLWLGGRDLRDSPLYERKALLASILPHDRRLVFSAHIEGKGKAFFKEMKKRRFEGMLAKDSLSPYREGKRGTEWLKVKTWLEQEAVIVGFTAPRKTRKNLGALVLAAYSGRGKNKRLTYIGHSGGGFTEKELADLHTKLGKIRTKTPPIDEKVPVNSPITWVRPKYVCEMRFSEWTPEGRMRHPIYTGMRPDKKPSEVVKEMPK